MDIHVYMEGKVVASTQSFLLLWGCLILLFFFFFFPLGCMIEAVNLKSSNRNPVVHEFESKYRKHGEGWGPLVDTR
jgi:hypothetical protein